MRARPGCTSFWRMVELPKTPQSSGFRRLVVMLAVIAVIGLAAVLYRDALRPPPPRVPPLAAGEPDDPVARAMRLAGVDSTKKDAWVDELPNADLASLGAGRTELFLRFANTRRCTCGCGFTLAACQVYDPSCEVSGPIVAALRDSVARGLLADARGLRERPRPAAP